MFKTEILHKHELTRNFIKEAKPCQYYLQENIIYVKGTYNLT